ncbi:MbnP family protein [Chitinophaga caeni]|nr:MbnP family protein [Chitinophaga caeni]
MKIFSMPSLIAILLLSTAIVSCKKDDPEFQQENMATLSIEFDNIVGGQNLVLDNSTYTNSSGEKYTVNLLKYFISNIKVTKANGDEYTVPQDSSYFLINEADPETRFAKVNVPEGEYTQLTFTLGVDSLRNTMDISKRTGVLDPAGEMAEGMYWTWNSGYIFFKMEGSSDAAPADPTGQHKFRYHIGGFGGYDAPTINNIKTITIDLTQGGVPKVRSGREANIHLMVDISKVFSGNTTLSIAANPTVMFSAFSVNIADNYAAMFHHDHTEN